MATSFDTKYKKNIEGLAKANNVDVSTAGAMLRSNLAGTTSYKGGGVLDFNVANADLKSAQTPQPQTTSSRPAPVSPEQSYMQDIQKAYEARQKAMQEGLNTQLGEIKTLSDDNRSQTYVNSRLSAIGNNERLATQGLAGGLYDNPTSGKSESSRIQQDVALGNNINAVNRQQTSLEAQARNAVATGLADNQLEMAKTIAQLRQQQAQNERAEFTNTIGAYGQDYMQEILNIQNDGDPSNDWKIPYLQSARNQKISGIEQSKAEAEQQTFENQLKLMETQYKVGKPYYKPSSGGTGSSDTAKSLLSATEVKGLVAKDEDGKVDEKATLSNLLKQKNIGNLSEADYAKYVGLYVPSKKIGGTSFDGAKVQQLVNGLGTYMLTGGSKNAVLTQIENLYWSGDLSQTEANAILQQFGISGI